MPEFQINGVTVQNVLTPVGRLINANVDKPRAYVPPNQRNNPNAAKGIPKYSVRMILPFTDIGDLWEATLQAADLGWPAQVIIENGQQVRIGGREMLQRGMIHNPMRNGDEAYMLDPKKNANLQHHVFFNASSSESIQPVCFDARHNPISPNLIYPGCYARLALNIRPFGHDNQQATRGVTYYLQGVEFVADGPRLGGGAAATANAFASRPVQGHTFPVTQQPAPQPPMDGAGTSGPNYAGFSYSAGPMQPAPQPQAPAYAGAQQPTAPAPAPVTAPVAYPQPGIAPPPGYPQQPPMSYPQPGISTPPPSYPQQPPVYQNGNTAFATPQQPPGMPAPPPGFMPGR